MDRSGLNLHGGGTVPNRRSLRRTAAVLVAFLGRQITVDLKNVLAQLRAERDAVDTAISNLERLAYERHLGPGRPSGFVTKSSTAPSSSRRSPSPPSAPSRSPS